MVIRIIFFFIFSGWEYYFFIQEVVEEFGLGVQVFRQDGLGFLRSEVVVGCVVVFDVFLEFQGRYVFFVGFQELLEESFVDGLFGVQVSEFQVQIFTEFFVFGERGQFEFGQVFFVSGGRSIVFIDVVSGSDEGGVGYYRF